MPLIEKEIGGVKYGFAPLKLRELRAIGALKKQNHSFESLEQWKPFIEASMKRAGSEMPDIEDMDIETAGKVFADLIFATMEASSIVAGAKGEEVPAAATSSIGDNSTAS